MSQTLGLCAILAVRSAADLGGLEAAGAAEGLGGPGAEDGDDVASLELDLRGRGQGFAGRVRLRRRSERLDHNDIGQRRGRTNGDRNCSSPKQRLHSHDLGSLIARWQRYI